MASLPSTMRSLVAPRKCKPSQYEIQDMPTPIITKPDQVIIRMHAVGMTAGELLALTGAASIVHRPEYPAKIGLEGSGVVVAVGSKVKGFKIGDAVYSLAVDKPMFRSEPPGFASEYGITEEHLLLHKPPQLSFEDAASLPGSVITGYQAIRKGLQLRGETSLEGKTILVPAGLGSTGSAGIQLAKHVFGASKVITTVSTSKVPLVEVNFPGVVDTVIDYKTQDVKDVVAPGAVDVMYNTQFSSMDQGIPVLDPDRGILVSIASVPSKATMREIIGEDRFPLWLGWFLDIAQLWYMWKLWGTHILFAHVSGGPNIREDYEAAGEIIARGQVKALVDVVDVSNIDRVREKCQAVLDGKGTTGKVVLRIEG